jgi:hypothetical protein
MGCAILGRACFGDYRVGRHWKGNGVVSRQQSASIEIDFESLENGQVYKPFRAGE